MRADIPNDCEVEFLDYDNSVRLTCLKCRATATFNLKLEFLPDRIDHVCPARPDAVPSLVFPAQQGRRPPSFQGGV